MVNAPPKEPAKESGTDEKRKEIMALRKKNSDRAFALMWQFVMTILVPAMLAVFIGKKIDQHYGQERFYVLILSGIAFILSWVIIIIRYRQYKNFVIQVQDKIKSVKEKNDCCKK